MSGVEPPAAPWLGLERGAEQGSGHRCTRWGLQKKETGFRRGRPQVSWVAPGTPLSLLRLGLPLGEREPSSAPRASTRAMCSDALRKLSGPDKLPEVTHQLPNDGAICPVSP